MFGLGVSRSGLLWQCKVDLDSVWQVWSGEVLHGVVGCLAARLGVARLLWARLGRAGVVGLVVASRVEA